MHEPLACEKTTRGIEEQGCVVDIRGMRRKRFVESSRSYDRASIRLDANAFRLEAHARAQRLAEALRRLPGNADDDDGLESIDIEPPTVKAERLAWSTVRPFRRFVGAYLVYAFVFGITFGVSGFYHASGGFGEQACIAGFGPACVIGGCLLLVAFAVRQEKFGLGTLSQIISPLLAALFLLHMLFDTLFSTWLPSITFSLWWIVLTFLFLTMVDLVWRTPSDGRTLGFAVCWALAQTALAAGAVTAQVTSFVFGTAALTANAITACSLVLVVIATAMLVGAPTPFSKTPDELGCAEGDAPHAAMPGTVADPLLGICADIARTHDLTAREEEVLVLLAQGHTRNGIARKLVVSDNTVRAHVKSIYHKLRIHSKQELVNIVDARRAAH